MDAEVTEWTDWIPDIERIKRMQADIDALKCERASLQCTIDDLSCDKRELITALSDVLGYVDFGVLDDCDEDFINCARIVLYRYRS